MVQAFSNWDMAALRALCSGLGEGLEICILLWVLGIRGRYA
jgi:hypothetical protein